MLHGAAQSPQTCFSRMLNKMIGPQPGEEEAAAVFVNTLRIRVIIKAFRKMEDVNTFKTKSGVEDFLYSAEIFMTSFLRHHTIRLHFSFSVGPLWRISISPQSRHTISGAAFSNLNVDV